MFNLSSLKFPGARLTKALIDRPRMLRPDRARRCGADVAQIRGAVARRVPELAQY